MLLQTALDEGGVIRMNNEDVRNMPPYYTAAETDKIRFLSYKESNIFSSFFGKNV